MAIDGPRAVLRFIARGGKRVAVTIAGVSVVVLGLVLLVTPGPGILVVILGLALLATEYAWAERMLDKIRQRSKDAYDRARRRFRRSPREP
ncbi:MAG TPA: PGPGW domain-containing protein [Actinomycetota bacterium]